MGDRVGGLTLEAELLLILLAQEAEHLRRVISPAFCVDAAEVRRRVIAFPVDMRERVVRGAHRRLSDGRIPTLLLHEHEVRPCEQRGDQAPQPRSTLQRDAQDASR